MFLGASAYQRFAPSDDRRSTKSMEQAAARLRIRLTHLWRHRRLPDLTSPRRFNDLVQVRKLRDRNPMMPLWADKVAAKTLVADRLGAEWVTPLLWSGHQLPDRCSWQGPVVVKARHGCRQNAFVQLGARDWDVARVASAQWMRSRYGWWLDEWLYGEIPRGLLVEPFIGAAGQLPIDYKIFVFGGAATHVQVHIDRASRHRWIVHDRDWQPLASCAPPLAKPSALSAMLAAAEQLAAGFDFVRVDFYQPESQPLFGEMTFYPGSGLDPIEPPGLDEEFGRLWLQATTLLTARARRKADFDTWAGRTAENPACAATIGLSNFADLKGMTCWCPPVRNS